MGNNLAFQACGKTYLGNATGSSQTLTIVSDSPCNQVLVVNPLGNAALIAVSSNSAVSITAPANGAPQYAVAVAPNSNMVLTIPQQFSNMANTYIAFAMTAGTGSIYFTPGEGLTT